MKDKIMVVVESPTKAKTIGKILGAQYNVVSSMGHLIDLPAKELGVDIDKDFEPSYVIISGRRRKLAELKKASKDSKTIYVATDPDREGEAIGWHIKNRIFKDKEVLRVEFHEITVNAIKEAFTHPRDFNQKIVESQIGRRVLDRIVGFFLSPLLWKKIVRGLSAGRVQSIALKIIIDRERQILSFKPQEYWELEASLKKKNQGEQDAFTAKLSKINERDAEIKNKDEADLIVKELEGKSFVVTDIKTTEKKRNSDPPFITSTLQQDSFNKLRYNATKTMIIAQQLYEGVDIGEESPVGLITYMRTDSMSIAAEAQQQVREHILKYYGKEYLPETPPVYKAKKFAQQAHEAIRPTSLMRSPESMQQFLSQEQFKLYSLIYNRFIASQMSPAKFLITTATIKAEKYIFTVSGSKQIFEGFTVVYRKENNEEKEKNNVPELDKNELLDLLRLVPSQHFTKPPPRFSDSSLVKILEDEGVGRPSTYAPIISTLILRDYVRRVKGYFHPTELGFKVCDLLVEYFPKIMDIKFTALLEEQLDEIEEGNVNKLKVLKDFYEPFKTSVDFAQLNIKKEVVTSEELCPQCGKQMVVKWGRKGRFLSCSGYPECKGSKSITTNVVCPEPGCGGQLVERRSRRGFFYGCTNYPKCTFTSRNLPETKEEGNAK